VTLYKRLFAFAYHLVTCAQPYGETIWRDVCSPLLAEARGKVLEIGAGTGLNLPLYSPDARLTLLEPNLYMHPHLLARAERLGRKVHLIGACVEAIPCPDNCFDSAVSIHVLCSVRDQARALSEVRRVLKPGGIFLYMEHVAAEVGTLAHRAQCLVDPVWRLLGDGCHLTRHTDQAISEAGFSQVHLQQLTFRYAGLVGPHIVGHAIA
jgi:ubiquinone/menaquinone biosynthesis C-methylase UbiE